MILNRDLICFVLKYLEIYDVYSFVKSNKEYWKCRKISRLFKEYYYNADMAFVAMAWKCWGTNQRDLFRNLCLGARKYKMMLAREFVQRRNSKLFNMIIDSDNKILDRIRSGIVNEEKLMLINLPFQQLKNVNWIWHYNTYTIFFGMSLSELVINGPPPGFKGDYGPTDSYPGQLHNELELAFMDPSFSIQHSKIFYI